MPKLGMKEIRKDQVTAATKRCILKKGLSNMSVKDIAEEAGLSTGIIYHYFKNKDDLLLQVLKDSFRKSEEQVRETVNPIENSNEKLSNYIDNLNRMPIDNPEFMIIFMNYLGEAKFNPNIQQIVKKFIHNLQSFIIENFSNEEIDNDRMKKFSVILSALGVGLGMIWTLNNDAFDIDEMAETIKQFVLPYLISK
jgi:TetR/AcrR family transcriptional regulator, transcriptional repressor of bet genes